MKNKKILLISPEAWGANFVSKHHYANNLAKHNTVYFLNPVLSSKINPFGKINIELKNVKENLVQVNYQNLLPRLNRLPKLIQKYLFNKQAKQIQKALKVSKFDIVWSFDPHRFWNQTFWIAHRTIYHTVDFHPNTSYEYDLIKSSDLKLSISNHIPSKEISKDNSFQTINHGFDNLNTKADLKNIAIPGKNNKKAVYVGNVANLLDKVRLNQLAINHSDIDFILIGPNSNSNLSIANKEKTIIFANNVFCIGELNANMIDLYLRQCDINLLILKNRKGIKNINSHKLMHYFYSGNITISDWLMDYTDNSILNMAKSPEEFETLFSKVIHNLNFYNSTELKEKRKQFALANTYENKIEIINNLLYKN